MHISPFISMDNQGYILVVQVGNTWPYGLLIIILNSLEQGKVSLGLTRISVSAQLLLKKK
jgi:hypothetical protein